MIYRDLYAAHPGPIEWGVTCPRRIEGGSPLDGEDGWDRSDDTCTYCGSLHPDVFMARLTAGNIRLEPTGKNYKVYVGAVAGPMFKQTYRTDSPKAGDPFDPSTATWTTVERTHAKFYFQHLSEDQKREFIGLMNARAIKLDYPGHFYVMPFFMKREL